jgi:hypothetical protein
MNAWLLCCRPARRCRHSGASTKPQCAEASSRAQPAAAAAGKAAPRAAGPGDARHAGEPRGRDQVDASVPEKYRDEVASAQLEGARLQQEDFAVWVASNALVHSGIRAPGTPTGWLALPKDASAQAWTVSFTVEERHQQLVYADVDVDLTRPPPKIQFSPAARARTAAPTSSCSCARATRYRRARTGCAAPTTTTTPPRSGRARRAARRWCARVPARHDEKNVPVRRLPRVHRLGQGRQVRSSSSRPTPAWSCRCRSTASASWSRTCARDTPTLFHVFETCPTSARSTSRPTAARGWWTGRISVVDKKSLKSIKTEDPRELSAIR